MSAPSEPVLREDPTESLGQPPRGIDPAFADTRPASEALPSERRPIPPALRDRYRDVSLLGEGGMGTVFRAHDLRLGRAVALKLLRHTGPELVSRFLQEARAQARIRHENVCPVYDAGDAGGEPFIVMQLIEGEPLGRAKDHMSLEQKVMVMRKVAAAVHEAHRAGLIHRDIKPGNILVERGDDGSFKPYVMDFGLAREVTAQGQTLTGAVLGTPAYMAPEQARGDVRALDRRTDVYSLGATLYFLLADRTPFVEDQVWRLIMAVTTEDPPSLGGVKKGVPEELETIVMKCLERDPARRYDSARALGDDLQRFLDGEPVHARRAGLPYVLWKKAKKHKLAASLLAAALAAGVTLSGFWVKARREAEAQARMGQEMGESVKEMELFLRAAYELPLHDVEVERGVVRGRLAQIEERMRAAGRIADGPGHHALGRGYLALGDPSSARQHLERAAAAGYASPELSYSLGQALGELYRRGMEGTKRITGEEERKRKEAELARELRDPALAALRSAASARIEVPEHVEGLIAFYEGKYEDALAKAGAAFAKAPWMYEAKKLQADALFALGSRYRQDAAFDHDRMMAYFAPAAEAYRAAAEMARSDPEVHRAECELWVQTALADHWKGRGAAHSFERALAACDRATLASSADPRALVQRALALRLRAWASADAGGEDPTAAVEVALKAAEEAVRASPGDPMAQYTLAGSAYLAADQRFQRGLDASTERARAAFEEAIRLDPGFTWALDELGDVHALAAMLGSWRGEDPEPSLKAALRQYDRAMERDAAFLAPLSKKALAHALLVEHLLSRGRSPGGPLSELFQAAEALPSEGGGWWLSAYWRARAHRLRARQEAAAGEDPRASIEAALSALQGPGEEVRKDYWLSCEIAETRSIEAQHAVDSGQDPGEALREAREAARRAVTARPHYLDPRVLRARIEIVAIVEAIGRGKVEEPLFAAALEPLQPLMNEERADPQLYEAMAEIHWLHAKSSPRGAPSAGDEIARGLSMADMALPGTRTWRRRWPSAASSTSKGRASRATRRPGWPPRGGQRRHSRRPFVKIRCSNDATALPSNRSPRCCREARARRCRLARRLPMISCVARAAGDPFMKKSRLVALSIAGASLVALGCNGQPGDVPVSGDDLDVPLGVLGGGPTVPNGASPACLANPDVRQAIHALGEDKVITGGVAPDGTPMLPSMPAVPAECHHILKDLMECALRDDQRVMDQDNGEVYTGQVGLGEEWDSRGLYAEERRWVSACMVQRLNYFGISVPILLEGQKAEIEIDEAFRGDYPFAESTAWGDIFIGSEGRLAWICTEEDVWSICPKDLGEPWVDTRVCDGVQDCGIGFAGRCSDACNLTAGGYWDCSAQYGFLETVRVRMKTNTHEPVLGACN